MQIVRLYGHGNHHSEKLCEAEGGSLLTSPSQLSESGSGSRFNCTYHCFSARSPIRGPEEILATKGEEDMYLMPDNLLGISTIIAMLFLYAMILLGLARSLFEAQKRWLVRKTYAKKTLKALNIWVIPLMVLFWAVLWESLSLYNLQHQEEKYAVGQWAPIVGSTFVLLATLFDNYFLDPQRDRGNFVTKRGEWMKEVYSRCAISLRETGRRIVSGPWGRAGKERSNECILNAGGNEGPEELSNVELDRHERCVYSDVGKS